MSVAFFPAKTAPPSTMGNLADPGPTLGPRPKQVIATVYYHCNKVMALAFQAIYTDKGVKLENVFQR